jgi:spiro-SPASM protein
VTHDTLKPCRYSKGSMVHLVVAAPHSSPYLDTAFANGYTPLEYVTRRIATLRTALETEGGSSVSVHTIGPPGGRLPAVPTNWMPVVPEVADASGVLAALHAVLPPDEGPVVIFHLDAPFVDLRLTRYLLRLHNESWCDYTFADGYPQGFAPELLRRGVLPVLAELAKNLPWTRSALFDALSRDINAFDIETEAASEDYALLRLSLTVDTRSNYTLCRRLTEVTDVAADPAEANLSVPDPGTERFPDDGSAVLAALRDDPSLGRILPYYYQIQVTDEMVQRPSYLPWSEAEWAPSSPGEGTHLSPARWKELLAAIAQFSPEATISIGYRGEPALHPDLPALIAAAADHPGISLYVETSGLGWNDEALAAIEAPVVRAVIVELDSIDPGQYEELRGSGYDEAMATIERMRHVLPGRLYVQATRMKSNEWDLQKFFSHWDQIEGVTPLIEKYNSWAGRLADRSVMDLAPLERIPCRHLQRDMVVSLDGTVPRCFQDLDGDGTRGNLFSGSISAVWNAGEDEYAAHVRGEYPSLCRKCDEYYTFNA